MQRALALLPILVLLTSTLVPRVQAGALVLADGNIYTASASQPHAAAVVAVDGIITFVGDTAEARRRAPAGAEVIALAGRTVLPGLTDAHAHLEGIGQRELAFNLEGTSSVADLQARVKQRAAAGKPGEWITGRGWIESRWAPAVFPTRADLDAVVADRPVWLRRADGHAGLANSFALRLAAIDRNTAAPAGGEILKDPATGEPTGLLVDNAKALIDRLVPEPSVEERLRALEVGAERSVRVGWTQVHIPGNSWAEVERLCQLYRAGKIKLRIHDAVSGPGADAERLLNEGSASLACSDRLAVRAIKLYIDGALGSRGAALLAPYSDAPESSGLLVNREEQLFPLLTSALRKGIQIETHAIGDRGNRIMLDLYEKAFVAVPVAQRAVAAPRWRIEHAQILDPADIPRFAKLGVIASMQPSHAISDLYFAPSRIGPERLRGAYAWRSLLDSGATIAAGSDAPVERGEPMIEFYAAVARRSLDGFADDNWHREQRVSREEALRMLTIAPAFAAFQEKERGTIEPGKQADFTVLSADIMRISEAEILKTRVVMTIIGGEVVFAPLQAQDE
jgi:predicted amidohydrolase YtcJ